jgi:hypothetical protein
MRKSSDHVVRAAKPGGLQPAKAPLKALKRRGKSIVNRLLTRIADNLGHQGPIASQVFAARNARKMRRECSAFG